MSSGENGHSSHHHKKHSIMDFLVRIFKSIRHFFHELFRPVRRVFRKLGRASDRAYRKLQHSVNDVRAVRGRKREARKEKRRQRKKRRQTWVNEHTPEFIRKLGEKRAKRAAKRLERREARWARLEKRIPHVDHAPGYLPGIERARIILMFFMCVNLLGPQNGLGGLLKTVCGFVPPAFFLLSGYLVLRESEHRAERIKRAVKRSAMVFGILMVVYFVLNLVFYRLVGLRIGSAFTSKRFWFNFLVLNVWQFDIGSAIWYVQALLYAYIIIFFLDKWKLLKYDWVIAAVLLVFAVVTGELCGLVRWEWHGYTYIPGNFLTRALPYILLGSVISKKKEKLLRLKSAFYVVGVVLGIVLIFAEAILLAAAGVQGYYGHLIGMGVIAFSVCMLAVKNEDKWGFERLFGLSGWHINSIYYLCQPVSLPVVMLLSALGGNIMGAESGLVSVVTFFVCFGLAWLAAAIGREASKQWAGKVTASIEEDEEDEEDEEEEQNGSEEDTE